MERDSDLKQKIKGKNANKKSFLILLEKNKNANKHAKNNKIEK